MDAMSSGDESYDRPISTEMLEDVYNGTQYHLRIDRREARYKKHACI